MSVRTRTAPSPTGDPHVGTAYRALFDSAFARHERGQYLLRIEDTDQERYVPSSEQQIFDALRWLGLDWDEGPDKGGPHGPYRQSERKPLYQRHAQQLVDAGHAYYCWCSPERLEAVRAEQQRQKQPPRYDRFCLGKTRDQRAAEPGFKEPPVVRLLVPEDVPLEFDDLIRGRIGAPRPTDPVLLKSDGFPTYHLAVVVDDHLMEVSHVTRGEEWISSTPIHLQLYRAFGWQPPRFAHFPLLRNPDGSKISKRKNPAARLLWFKEQGFLPEALLNFLALMGFSLPDEREKFRYQDLVDNFAWERFSTSGPVFDVDKLDWLNAKYISELTDEELLRRLDPYLPGPTEPDALRILAPDLKTRLKRLSQVRELLEFLYLDKVEPDPHLLLKQGLSAEAASEALRTAESIVVGTQPYARAPLMAALEDAIHQHGWNKRKVLMTVRVAVTGRTDTPPLDGVLAALGRARTTDRLRDAIDLVSPGVA